VPLFFTTTGTPLTITTGDFNADKNPDLISVNAGQGAVATAGVTLVGQTANVLLNGAAAVLTPTVTLRASADTAVAGVPITLTATVAGTAGTPTGTVTFAQNDVPNGSVALLGGQASLMTI